VDSGCEHPSEAVMRKEDSRLLHVALSKLSAVELHIVDARFGIKSEKPESLEHLAAIYQVSRERIRQIQKAALNKMQLTARRLLRPKLQRREGFVANGNDRPAAKTASE
jgi:RNA polymerase primary sigma factor